MQDLLIPIFCDLDDFCINQEKHMNNCLLQEDNSTRVNFNVSKTMHLSEIMTIIVYFYLSGYRNFKTYYKQHVAVVLKEYFPTLVSYNNSFWINSI